LYFCSEHCRHAFEADQGHDDAGEAEGRGQRSRAVIR
jgi:hypothetical protein